MQQKVGDSLAADQHVQEECEVDAVVGDQVDGQTDVLQRGPVGGVAQDARRRHEQDLRGGKTRN